MKQPPIPTTSFDLPTFVSEYNHKNRLLEKIRVSVVSSDIGPWNVDCDGFDILAPDKNGNGCPFSLVVGVMGAVAAAILDGRLGFREVRG